MHGSSGFRVGAGFWSIPRMCLGRKRSDTDSTVVFFECYLLVQVWSYYHMSDKEKYECLQMWASPMAFYTETQQTCLKTTSEIVLLFSSVAPMYLCWGSTKGALPCCQAPSSRRTGCAHASCYNNQFCTIPCCTYKAARRARALIHSRNAAPAW